MNFKTPFKVLTTAALIGTLSLSAVAPGAASAAENKTAQSKAGEEVNFPISKAILSNGTSTISVPFEDYIAAAGSEAALNGYELKFLVAEDGTVYSLEDYVAYYNEGDEPTKVFENLDKAEKATEAPADVKDGNLQDGKLDADTDETPEPADKADLEKAIEDAKAVEAKDEATQTALDEAITAAEAVVAKEDATAEEVKVVLDALTEAVTAATPVVVESVTAITQTIAKSTATALKFEVNGKEYTTATFAKEFADYTVDFKFSNPTVKATLSEGKVSATEDFKYAVEIKDKDGNAVNTVANTDYVTVKVAEAATAVKVNELGLVDGSAVKFAHESVLKGETAKIVATKYENALGQDEKSLVEGTANKVVTAPTVKNVVSSDPTIAYYDKTDGIKVLKDGKVTFTVEFNDIEEKSTIEVNVKKEQTVASAKAADQKIANDASSIDLGIKFYDEAEEELHAAPTVYYTTTLAGKNEASTATETAPVAADFTTAGVYTVNVYKAADKKEKLGSFKVESVEVAANAKIDDYKLAYAKDADEKDVTTLDLNSLLTTPANETTLTAKGFIKEIEQPLTKGLELVAKSSDNKIVKVKNANGEVAQTDGEINLQAVAEGEATITLYTVEGDIETPVATAKITVENSAPQVTELTLKKDTKVDGKATDLKAAVIAAVNEEIKADQIDEVTPVEANGVVLVDIKDEFGGKTFTLDAKFEDATLQTATATISKASDTPAVVATATIAKSDVEGLTDGQTIKIGDKTYTVSTTATVDAAVSALTGNNAGVTASKDEKTGDLVLTGKEDGIEFTYVVNEKSTTTNNGTEFVAGNVTDASVLLTFSQELDITEGTATLTIDGQSVSGKVAKVAGKANQVKFTANDATEAAKVVVGKDVTALTAVKAANGSALKFPTTAIKVTAAQ